MQAFHHKAAQLDGAGKSRPASIVTQIESNYLIPGGREEKMTKSRRKHRRRKWEDFYPLCQFGMFFLMSLTATASDFRHGDWVTLWPEKKYIYIWWRNFNSTGPLALSPFLWLHIPSLAFNISTHLQLNFFFFSNQYSLFSRSGASSLSLTARPLPSFASCLPLSVVLFLFVNYRELRAFGGEKNKKTKHRQTFLFVLFQTSLICFTYAHCLSLASLLVAWHRFSCIFFPPSQAFLHPFIWELTVSKGALSRCNVLRSLRAETCSLWLSSPFFSSSNYLFLFSSIPRPYFPLQPYWNVDTTLLTRLPLNI